MKLIKHEGTFQLVALEPAEPLYKYVPTRGADGRPLFDFMMLIPKLKTQPQEVIERTLERLQYALAPFEDVVFVDFNLKINVLWVSFNQRAGLLRDLVDAIQHYVPEAKLVMRY